MFGSHLSIAGGLEQAVADAASLGFDCVQVFTRNQRRWESPPLEAEEIERFLASRRAHGWLDDPGRVVSHNSYLVNLAAPAGGNRDKSIKAQRAELERCEALGILRCVIHPGAHLGTPPPRGPRVPGAAIGPDERAGIERVADALDEIHRDLPGLRVVTLLENTVGSGTNLGAEFAHLAAIRARVREPERIGFCLDTCHAVAAGWDMSTPARARAVLEAFDEACGLDRLLAFHLNDSKGALGSRLDRHEHVGKGQCGEACFRAIVRDPRFARIPKILETPKETDADQEPWDAVNLARLRAMQVRRRVPITGRTRGDRVKDRSADDSPRRGRSGST